MAVTINNITITPNITTVGQPINIMISAEEVLWNNLRNEYYNWDDVKNNFTNWRKVKDYQPNNPIHYTKFVIGETELGTGKLAPSEKKNILGVHKLGDFVV